MSLSEFRSSLGAYARDTKINLGRVLDEDGAPGLNTTQIGGIALASAYATANRILIDALSQALDNLIDEAVINAARAAATIMAMNNVYYRFTHLVSDDSYASMPASLRMSVIGNPGVDRVDFELMSLAVSALNGCGMCMDAHVNELKKADVSKEGIQSAVRIAAVIAAAAQAQRIGA